MILATPVPGRESTDKLLEHIAKATDVKTDKWIRVLSILAIGDSKSEEAVKHLVPLLTDRDETIRLATILSLGHIESKSAKRHLDRLVQSESIDYNVAVRVAIAKCDPDASVDRTLDARFDEITVKLRATAESRVNK